MQSLNLPDPKKAEESSDTSEGAAKQAARSARQDRGASAEPGAVSRIIQKLWNMLPGGPREKKERAASEERESSRLQVAIPVRLFGRDQNGQAFQETTRTLDVSRRGAKILTAHDLPADTHVWIENPGAGKFSIAKVIRKGERVDPQEVTEICVKVLELLDPEKIWSLESPPQDWERGFEPPTPAQQLEYLLARERLSRPEMLSYEAIETEVPEAKGEESLAPPSSAERLETVPLPDQAKAEPTDSVSSEADFTSPSSVSDRAIAPEPHVQFPSRAETAEAASGASSGTVRETHDPAALAWSADGRVTRHPGSNGARRDDLTTAIENSAQVVRRISESAMDSVNAAAAEALAQLKARQLKIEADLSTHATAHQSRLAEVPGGVEELERHSASLLEKFQRKLEAALSEFQAKGAAQIEEFQKSAETLLEQPMHRLREQSESLVREAEGAKNSILAAGEQARERLESVGAEMDSRYATLAEAHDKRMAELTSAEEALSQRAGVLLKDLEKSFEDALQSFQQRGTADRAELEKAAQELLENSRRKLQGHAETTLAGLGENARETLAMTAAEGRNQVTSTQQALEALARTAQERFDQRLSQKSKEQAEIVGHSSEAAVNTIRLTAERAVNRLETAKEKIEEGFSSWADVFQSRLGELSAGMEGLEHHSEALLRDFRRQLDAALQEFVEKKTSGATNFEEASHDVVERLTQQVEERAGTTLEGLKEEAEAIVRSAEEAGQANLTSAREALESATRAADLYAQRLAKTSADQNEQAWLAADDVVRSINTTADESIARMEEAQEKMEGRFNALIERYEKRMTEIVTEMEAVEKRLATTCEELKRQSHNSAPVDQPEEPLDLPQENATGAN